MKRNILIKKSFIFFMGLFSLGIASCDQNGLSNGPYGDEKRLGSLFRDAGVLTVPHLTEPVEIRLLDMNGREVALSDFRGKIVFLNFWATWCPSCRVEMPSMEKLTRKLKDKDFAMVSVSLQESASQVKSFFKEYGLTFTSLLDSTGDVGRRFGIRSIPTTFILDRDGKVIGGAVGARDWDGKNSVALFEYLIKKPLLAHKP